MNMYETFVMNMYETVVSDLHLKFTSSPRFFYNIRFSLQFHSSMLFSSAHRDCLFASCLLCIINSSLLLFFPMFMTEFNFCYQTSKYTQVLVCLQLNLSDKGLVNCNR